MDWVDLIRALVSLAFVMVLIVGVAMLWRKYGNPGWIATPGKTRRLKVLEYLPLDSKNRLALVQKDDQELLLLLSQDKHSVIAGPDKAAVQSKKRTKAPKK